MSVHFREQTADTSLHHSSSMDSVTLRAFLASDKEWGRNTEIQVTMTAWHEGLQKRRLFLGSDR